MAPRVSWPRAGLIGLALVAVLVLGQAAWRVSTAAELARRSLPYQQSPSGATMSLLIVGDSTAVGTGASSPARSLAGLIGAEFARLRIVNRGRDGATLAELPAQLQGGGRYDLVLVMAGGNDIIRLRDMAAVRRDLDRVLALAGERAPQVLLMPAGNVGNAPFFFAPLSWWMTQRARAFHAQVRQALTGLPVTYVNLFEEREDDPFVQQPGLHAADGLHPGDAGYALWLEVLDRQAALRQRLAPARAR
jgi:lysophospholipase L1-like esterase